jgi:ABC-type glycerol-3-phosphate transport system permease component
MAVDVTRSAPEMPARSTRHQLRGSLWLGQSALYALVLVALLLTFAPLVVMLTMSFRNNGQIYANFWGLPDPWLPSNYAASFARIIHYTVNSTLYTLAAMLLTVLLSSLAGYVFARQRFAGKEPLFILIIGLLMIPGILTLTPSFVLVHQIGIANTPLALILPWAAGGQVLGIFLCRSFIANLPQELFEAARIDGASEWQLWYMIAVPLCWPILMTIAILTMVADYNDFIWPLLVIADDSKQVVSVGLYQFTSSTGIVDYGPLMAACAISAVPLVVAFFFGMRYFMQGITSGAIKA